MEDKMKQAHVDAFNFANEVATAIDASHGDDFKTAFIAAVLVEVKRHQLAVAPVLDPDKGKGKGKAKKATGRPRVATALEYAVRHNATLNTPQAAFYLGMPTKRFENLRTHGRGPRGVQVGRMWTYTREALDDFKASQQAEAAEAEA